VSYNILDGGAGRAEALAEVIEAQRPDLVGLVEAEDVSVCERIASRLKFDVLHSVGNHHASALLTRWPVRESINHAPLHKSLEKSLLEATVVEPAGREWVIGVVHLHAQGLPEDEDRRMEEVDVLLNVFERHRNAGRPHLIVGDFNANAPYQRIDPQKCKPRTRREFEQTGGNLPRRVVRRMLDTGYADSLREVDAHAAETVGSFTTEFPGQRVDYVFTHGFGRNQIRSAWVEQGGRAREASDHFPVGVEIV
jgi:endonuclease/exonuclease/phosphatase family metal-dependent hydrolase